MSEKKINILSEERVFNNYFKVDEAKVKHTKSNGESVEYSRMKLVRPDAVAVLIVNEETQKVILVEQFRYPVADRESKNILEVVAGKIDGNEEPQEAACREVLEEIGYKISKENLSNPLSVYISPGYSTEKIHIFIARVDNSMKVASGGGVETEHEDIDIVELNSGEFMVKCQNGEICDAKTILSSNMLLTESINKLLDLGATISKE
jgi:ADP-ribose pyrophosphatase